MSTANGQSVGIDVSEQSLDVHLHPAGLERRLPYTLEGITSLIDLLKAHEIDRVVLESTGGLQRRLERSLRDAKYSVSVVNPERIWAYRRLVGRAAKTDRVDARLISEYAATMRPAESLARSAEQHRMKELSSRRDQLIASIAAEKKRLRRVEHEVVRASVESKIAALEAEAKRIESAIEEAVSKDESTRSTAAILESIPGVGELTAQLLAIELPELGSRRETDRFAGRSGPAPGREWQIGRYGLHSGWSSASPPEAVHVGVQRAEVQPGDRGVLRTVDRAGENIQASDDGVHAEAVGADEHAGGSRPGLGPIARDLIPGSTPDLRKVNGVVCPDAS